MGAEKSQTSKSALDDLVQLMEAKDWEAADQKLFRETGLYSHKILSGELNTTQGGILLHSALHELNKKASFWGESLATEDRVKTIEREAQYILGPLFGDVKHYLSEVLDSSLQTKQQEEMVIRSLGASLWKQISGLERNKPFWGYIRPTSVDQFISSVPTTREFQNQYPLLSAFVEQEPNLQNVKYIIPILQWHKLIFDTFPVNELTREQATSMSNLDVIKALSPFQKEEGIKIMNEFCDAFNKTFRLVRNILECQANPYITKGGDVDLSGSQTGKVPMSPEAPLIFSIPYVGHDARENAPSLCTINLLLRLHNLHENSLGIVKSEKGHGRTTDGPDFVLPQISCDSPLEMLRQKLIFYERERDFLPLIVTSRSREGIDDYCKIEQKLRVTILRGKQSLRLHVRHFKFKSDMRKSGALIGLRQRVPQVGVSGNLLGMLFDEADTKERIIRLLNHLEVVVEFIARVGGEGVKGLKIGDTLIRFEKD